MFGDVVVRQRTLQTANLEKKKLSGNYKATSINHD